MGLKLRSRKKYKKRRKQRPVIRITGDHLSLLSVVLDAGILLLLIVWFLLEIGDLLP